MSECLYFGGKFVKYSKVYLITNPSALTNIIFIMSFCIKYSVTAACTEYHSNELLKLNQCRFI